MLMGAVKSGVFMGTAFGGQSGFHGHSVEEPNMSRNIWNPLAKLVRVNPGNDSHPRRSEHSTDDDPNPATRFGGNARPADDATTLRLPPGQLDYENQLDAREKADHLYLQKQAAILGPIFKGIAWDEVHVCLVGLALSRRFLSEHEPDLLALGPDLSLLVPNGFLPGMNTDDHRDYRRCLVRAVRAESTPSDRASLESFITEGLRNYSATAVEHGDVTSAYSAAMSTLATGLLIQVFFGAVPGSRSFTRLVEGFGRLGPHGLVWNPKQRQAEAFSELSGYLHDDLLSIDPGSPIAPDGSAESSTPTCLLFELHHKGELDATMLGNLIYMVEMGRSDIQNLFRWITTYAARNPDALAAIASETVSVAGGTSPSESFILEVLRTEQAERLERRTVNDIMFEGYFIPAETNVRLCLWEPHHNEEMFPEPHRFDPTRFLASTPPLEVFAPFGLDQHQCPFGGLTIRIGTAFIRTIAKHFKLTLLRDGPSVRGAYHWEPPRHLTVHLEKR